MSKKYQLVDSKYKKLFFGAGIAFFFAIFLAVFTIKAPVDSTGRHPSSLEENKGYRDSHGHSSHNPTDHSGNVDSSAAENSSGLKRLHKRLSVHQKIQPPISVKIDKLNINKVYAGDEFEVMAEVSSKASTNNVKVTWKIPQFMEIISGEVDHVFEDFEAGEKRTVRIILKSHSEENQQIHIVASAPYGKQVLSAVDQFNSTDEEDIREAKAALVERNLNYK